MTDYKQFVNLFKVLLFNAFDFKKFRRRASSSKGKGAEKIGLVIFAVFFGGYTALAAFGMTLAAGPAGYLKELIYTFLFVAQIIVLFFGGVAAMSYLYFSKDNALLSALPIKSGILFLAKIAVTYVTELFFSALVLIPSLTAIGITALVNGYGLDFSFFFFEIVATLTAPVAPLLLVAVFSLPLMYVVTFFKRRSAGNGIVLAIVSVAAIALYFAVVTSVTNFASSVGEEAVLPENTIKFLVGIKNATIFNYPIAEALAGHNAAINFLWHVLSIAAALAFAVGLSSLFYRRALLMSSELAPSKKKRKAKEEGEATVYRSFFLKEVRTLVHTTPLMISTVLGLAMTPAIMIFMSLSLSGGENEMPSYQAFQVGFFSFISFLMTSSTNIVSTIGFSREGQNMFTLKSLPVSGEMLVKVKFRFAMIITFISAFLAAVVYAAVTKFEFIVPIFGIPLITIVGGFGMNTFGLYSDLKNPNLRWLNITELTKNNKRQLKPMLIGMGIGFFFLIFGILLGIQTAITGELLFLVYFIVALVPVSIISGVMRKKLFENPEEMIARIEG
jgi:hypothetical protein